MFNTILYNVLMHVSKSFKKIGRINCLYLSYFKIYTHFGPHQTIGINYFCFRTMDICQESYAIRYWIFINTRGSFYSSAVSRIVHLLLQSKIIFLITNFGYHLYIFFYLTSFIPHILSQLFIINVSFVFFKALYLLATAVIQIRYLFIFHICYRIFISVLQ